MKNFISRIVIIQCFFLVFFSAHAQNDVLSLKGYIRDNFTDVGIEKAKVYLMNKDSVVLDSTETYAGYSAGYYHLRMKREKSIRSCIIKVFHADYTVLYSTQSLRLLGKITSCELPDIYIKRKGSFTDQLLDEVKITATKVKMFYRGDTLVYNADAFNVANGSMLDALIRQMPGTELTKQGEIFVNGKKIDNLLLNGKDFFRGKNHLMLENLPYYTVKEIKVYDKTTDKALALQDERAQKEYVMDVNLKKEYSKDYMANIEAGAGTEEAYLMRLFGLRFTDVSRFAIVGGINNQNMSDYSFHGSTSDAGNRDGRTTSNLLTAEWMKESKNTKNILTAELNKKKTEQGEEVLQETFHDAASTFSTTQSSSVNRNLGILLTNQYTLKRPFWLESKTCLRFNNVKGESDSQYYESRTDSRPQGRAVLDSLFSMGVALNDPSMISARKQWLDSQSKEYGVSQDFNFSKKLRSTDVIELNAGANYVKTRYDADRLDRYLLWKDGLTQTDVTEDINRPNTHVGTKAGAAYTISRLLYNTDLKFFVDYQYNHANNRESIFDVLSGIPDAMNSYRKRMNENRYSMGARYSYNFMLRDKAFQNQVVIELPLSIVNRKTDYKRYTVDTCLTQSPTFFEPSLMFSHKKFRKDANAILWDISASTSLKYSLPEATQLVTLPLTSDHINIYEGNASLKPAAIWTSSLKWSFPLKRKNTYIQQNLTYTSHINRIINTYRYDSGVYTNKPENINGTWNLDFSTRGQHFIKIFNLPFTINYSVKSNYLRMKNFAADGVTGSPLLIDNDELHNYAHLQFRHRAFGCRLSIDWRKPVNDKANIGYQDTWDYNADVWYNAKLFFDIDWETECVFTKRQGYTSDELNKLTCDWNMTLTKSILKNKLLLKLSAVDILHQYKSVAYTINEKGIRETHAVSLPSYVLFSMTYKFNKQSKKR